MLSYQTLTFSFFVSDLELCTRGIQDYTEGIVNNNYYAEEMFRTVTTSLIDHTHFLLKIGCFESVIVLEDCKWTKETLLYVSIGKIFIIPS